MKANTGSEPGMGMMRKSALLITFALVAAIYLVASAGRALNDDGDALYAHVARQMIEGGDWVTPYANGVRFLDKPPMMYWLMALSFGAMGPNELAARIPSVLAVLGIGMLLYEMARRAGGLEAGVAAALAIAFCPGTILFTLQVFPDILFVFFITLALYGFYDWYGRGMKAGSALLFYSGCAAAVLTKGALGVIFPIAIILVFAAWEGQLKALRRFHLLKGTILFLALAAPWHVAVSALNPGFFWYYFINEHVLRFLGRRQPFDYHTISLPLFWALILVWLFPWSFFLPALRQLVRDLAKETAEFRTAVKLGVSWVGVVLLFFSVSSRIEHYSLPILPPAALLVGLALLGNSRAQPVREIRFRWVGRGYRLLAFLGAAAGLGLLGLVAVDFGGHLSRWTRPAGPAASHNQAYEFYFAPIFDLPPEVVPRLRLPVVGTLLSLASLLPSAWWFHRRHRHSLAAVSLALSMAIFCLCVRHSMALFDSTLSSRPFAEAIERHYRTGDALVVIGDYETANTLNFYTRARLLVYQGRAAVLEWGMRYPDAPRVLLTPQEFQQIWSGPHRCMVLLPQERLPALALREYAELKRLSGRVLISNSPPGG